MNYYNCILGNSIEVMKSLQSASVNLIFADPPYNLQLTNILKRPNDSIVNGVNQQWDKFSNFAEYDNFTKNWLIEAKRILKPNGTIWTIGSYHNIFRVGNIMQNLNFWLLNDILWIKSNPMPNFRGTRFTNAHETLLWCSKNKDSSYTFNYHAMKSFNDDKQMRSDWHIPICNGKERIKNSDGSKAHPTQKPEALLYRILLSSSQQDDVVLDPFMGSGTTGAVCKKMGRSFIGIDNCPEYVEIAQKRINNIKSFDSNLVKPYQKNHNIVQKPFGYFVENGIITPGSILTDNSRTIQATVFADGTISYNTKRGSIHQVGAIVQGKEACNGWKFWYFNNNNNYVLIDELRKVS